jgi:hypothetical protein
MDIERLVAEISENMLARPDSKRAICKWLEVQSDLLALATSQPEPPEGTYHRVRIAATPAFEIYIIYWGLGADTGPHGHPEGGCWFKVLYGILTETTHQGVAAAATGTVGYQRGARGVHRVQCLEPAVSLHIYAPAAIR